MIYNDTVSWGVTETGYELFEGTGLKERIDENWDDISSLISYGDCVLESDIQNVLDYNNSCPERRAAVEAVISGKNIKDITSHDLFMFSGNATDIIVTPEEIKNPASFGVKGLSELDGLIAAYCLQKYTDMSDRECRGKYSWRSGAFKTIVDSRDEHLIITQVSPDSDISTKEQKDLSDFEKTSGLFGKLHENYLIADSSYWYLFLATTLKFVYESGIDIPEAEDWENTMKEYGWDGKISYPGISGGYDTFLSDFMRNALAYLPDGVNIRDVGKNFFGIMYNRNNVFYLPVIDEKKNLAFYTNYGDLDSVDFKPFGDDSIKCSPLIRISKEDILRLFKATFNGIMNDPRINSSYLAFMFWQYDQILERTKKDDTPELRLKIEEEIREEGFKLYF